MENMEIICTEMISYNGSARSYFMEAIKEAKNGNFTEADDLMARGDDNLEKGHKTHAKLIQQEAAGTMTQASLLLIHAEDLMMSAETLRLMAIELIDIHKRITG